MGLASALVALALAIGIAAATALIARDLIHIRPRVRELLRSVRRERAWYAEAGRYSTWREPVVVTTRTVRLGHELVAGLSFALLESFARTRPASQRVRAAHDSLADAVYDRLLGAAQSDRRDSPEDDSAALE